MNRDLQSANTQFVPCIESPDATHPEWVVCNYLDTDDIRFRGTYAECEAFIGTLGDDGDDDA